MSCVYSAHPTSHTSHHTRHTINTSHTVGYCTLFLSSAYLTSSRSKLFTSHAFFIEFCRPYDVTRCFSSVVCAGMLSRVVRLSRSALAMRPVRAINTVSSGVRNTHTLQYNASAATGTNNRSIHRLLVVSIARSLDRSVGSRSMFVVYRCVLQ